MVLDTLKSCAGQMIAAIACMCLAAITPAVAQESQTTRSDDAAPEITVTARKVSESILTAPLSVTSISRRTIDDAGLQSLADAIRFAPDVDFGGGIAGQLQGQISIRGISTLVRNIGLESSVGVYVDGVYVGRPENFAQQLLDIDHIEILRGPQSTEYGKNTIAGVIDVLSRQPDAGTGGFVAVSGGNYADFKAEAAYGGKLSETVSARGAISYAYQDGFYKNISGGKDAGSTNLLTWRLAAKFAPIDSLSFTLRGDGARDRGTPGFFQADALVGFPQSFPGNQPLHIDNNRPNRLSRDNAGISLTTAWSHGKIAIVDITAYRHSSYNAAMDDDQEQVDYIAADNFGDTSRLFTEELRATGQAGIIRYLIGGYYLNQTVNTQRELALGADLGFPSEPALTTQGRVKTISRAAFGRLDVHLAPKLQLSAGLRYTNEQKSAEFTQSDPSGIFPFLGFPDLRFIGRAHDRDYSPTVTTTWQVADDINVYGRYARGFKSAAFNVDIASSLAGLTAQPENASSYEAGMKLLLLRRRVQLNVSAFDINYDRLQVSEILGNGTSLTNAGKAKSEGIESELIATPVPSFRFEASAAVLNARYTNYQHCGIPGSLGGGMEDCSGKKLVLAPHFSARTALQYETPTKIGRFFARVDIDYRSVVYFEPTNSSLFEGAARTLLNMRVGLRRDQWEAALWTENLTNSIYKTYADDRSSIGVFRTAAYGAPRTFGITVRSEFGSGPR